MLAASLRYGSARGSRRFEDVHDVTLSDELIDLAAHIVEWKQELSLCNFNEDATAELIKSNQAGMPLNLAPASPSRDFVPWRFSEADRGSGKRRLD
jgi:hypothetical protein